MATRFLCRKKVGIPENGFIVFKKYLERKGVTLVCAMYDCDEINNLFGAGQLTTFVVEGDDGNLDQVCEYLEYENTGINALVFGEEVNIYCK